MKSTTHGAPSRAPGFSSLNDVAPAQIDRIFAKWNRTDSPGCALAVMYRGRIIFEHGYGMADLSHDVVITPATPFHVASVSKQFTSAAILLLEQEGVLSLDDDVRKYVPELHDFGTVVTLDHLLHHTSGLRDQWGLLNLAGYRYSLDLITDDDVMNLVLRQRELNFPPGTRYLYSNTGSTLLGQVIQRVSGETLREFTVTRIFEPLGMLNTHFRDDHAEINKGEALGYQWTKDGAYSLSVTNFDTVGATSLYTTVRDLGKWDANFYTSKIGGPDFARRMTQTQPLTSGSPNYYAMGLLLLQYRGLPIVEHSGGDAGYRADFLRFPTQHLSIAVLCNTVTNPLALARRVADLYLASQFLEPIPDCIGEEEHHPLTPEQIAGKAGFYHSPDSGTTLRLGGAEEGTLTMIGVGQNTPLRTDGRGRFFHPDMIDTLCFEPAEGEAVRMFTQGEGKQDEIWERLTSTRLSADAQKEFTGSYYSEELDTAYEIRQQGSKLVLTRKRYAPDDLIPIGSDLFFATLSGMLRFKRDRSGYICGLLLTMGRTLNLWFARQESHKNQSTFGAGTR